MRKGWVFIFALILIVCFSCRNRLNEKNPENDLGRWGLKGNIKLLKEKTYSQSGKYSTRILFNKEGNIIEQSGFNPDGSLIRTWIYKYENERKVSRDCYVQNDSLSYTLLYHYGANGKLKSTSLIHNKGQSGIRSELFYDDFENLIKEVVYASNNQVESEVAYKYDQRHRLIEENHNNSLGNKKWKQTFQYCKKGLKEKEYFFTTNDSLLQQIYYKYNKRNKLVEKAIYNASGELIEKSENKFEKNGNIAETNSLLQDGVLINQKYQYKYDKSGNWYFLVQYKNDNLEKTIERELEYYND